MLAGHRACLGALWVPCLHLPFCTHPALAFFHFHFAFHFLHSTLYSPLIRLSSCAFRSLLASKMIHLGSLCRTFGAPKFIKNHIFRNHVFGISPEGPRRSFGASPGSFGVILGQFLQVVVIVFCCFSIFSEVSGWGVWVGGSTVSEITLLSTKTFSASQPLTGTVRTCFATWIYISAPCLPAR